MISMQCDTSDLNDFESICDIVKSQDEVAILRLFTSLL